MVVRYCVLGCEFSQKLSVCRGTVTEGIQYEHGQRSRACFKSSQVKFYLHIPEPQIPESYFYSGQK